VAKKRHVSYAAFRGATYKEVLLSLAIFVTAYFAKSQLKIGIKYLSPVGIIDGGLFIVEEVSS
jgi:hypothetical protein